LIRYILLDSPLGLLCKPSENAEVVAISDWVADCLAADHAIYIPEVIDYELRRELIRARKVTSVNKLDSLREWLDFVPISSKAMSLAAQLWAKSRQEGQPTGDPNKLDIDVILAAQALTLDVPPDHIVIATANVAHLSRFVNADLWSNIEP
jgi:predicted nucleic acid-binding protein